MIEEKPKRKEEKKSYRKEKTYDKRAYDGNETYGFGENVLV